MTPLSAGSRLAAGERDCELSTQWGISFASIWIALGLSLAGMRIGKWVQNVGAIGTWIPGLAACAPFGQSEFKASQGVETGRDWRLGPVELRRDIS